MKNSSCLLSLLLLVASTVSAQSGTATLTWAHPTQHTDDSPLDIADIANTAIFYRADGQCAPAELSSSPNMVVVDAPATTAVIDSLSEATWCFAARTVKTDGVFSDLSNVATKSIGPDPRSPSALIAVESDTAYVVQASNDRIILLPIGTVNVLSVSCDTQVAVADSNGLLAYMIPADAVTSFGGQEVIAAFALCGG